MENFEYFGIEEAMKLYQTGWQFEIVDYLEGELKGLCNLEEKLIYICARNCSSPDDYGITMIHEGLHAAHPQLSEDYVEEFSRSIYEIFGPEIVECTQELFELPDFGEVGDDSCKYGLN